MSTIEKTVLKPITNSVKQTKLNESYTSIEGSRDILRGISEFLKVERPGAFFEPAVKSGFKSPFHYFSTTKDDKLIVLNGHLALLRNWGIYEYEDSSEFSESEVNEFMDSIIEKLPFNPYDYQILAAKESILKGKQINRMCTGCLDGNSEISINCDDYSYYELREMLRNNEKKNNTRY